MPRNVQYSVSDLSRKTDFEQLVARNRARLTAIARTNAPREADDLLQEILLHIWRGLASFQGRANIDTWCYRVALNTALSWQRSAQRRKLRLPPDGTDVNQLPCPGNGQDVTALLRQFLQSLSATDLALTLMYLEDMTGGEMAEVTGMTEGAIRTRLHRIKCHLARWQGGER